MDEIRFKQLHEKLTKTREVISQYFKHQNPYYLDSVLAAFASGINIMLLGKAGCGKTLLMKLLFRTCGWHEDYEYVANGQTTPEKSLAYVLQGYLNAEVEDSFVNLDIPALLESKEFVKAARIMLARMKGVDEIQRLGAGSQSVLLKGTEEGIVDYLQKQYGVVPFMWFVTANPTEHASDQTNIPLPDPLWDRFDAVVWMTKPDYFSRLEIDAFVKDKAKAIQQIWDEKDILELWQTTKEIELPVRYMTLLKLMIRVLDFCKYCTDADGSSINEADKRRLCVEECSQAYLCSRIAKLDGLRIQPSIEKLARGFAALRGSRIVSEEDILDAFPLAMWKRVKLIDEETPDKDSVDRLKTLKKLVMDTRKDIQEVQGGIALIQKLEERFNQTEYDRLKQYMNTKVWFADIVSSLDRTYEAIQAQLLEKKRATPKSDFETLAKISETAQYRLPPSLAKTLLFDDAKVKLTIKLTNENLTKIATVDTSLYEKAAKAKDNKEKEITFYGQEAAKLLPEFKEGKRADGKKSWMVVQMWRQQERSLRRLGLRVARRSTSINLRPQSS